jgi:hypothetical protein
MAGGRDGIGEPDSIIRLRFQQTRRVTPEGSISPTYYA